MLAVLCAWHSPVHDASTTAASHLASSHSRNIDPRVIDARRPGRPRRILGAYWRQHQGLAGGARRPPVVTDLQAYAHFKGWMISLHLCQCT
jgi:hypothetical protein